MVHNVSKRPGGRGGKKEEGRSSRATSSRSSTTFLGSAEEVVSEMARAKERGGRNRVAIWFNRIGKVIEPFSNSPQGKREGKGKKKRGGKKKGIVWSKGGTVFSSRCGPAGRERKGGGKKKKRGKRGATVVSTRAGHNTVEDEGETLWTQTITVKKKKKKGAELSAHFSEGRVRAWPQKKKEKREGYALNPPPTFRREGLSPERKGRGKKKERGGGK